MADFNDIVKKETDMLTMYVKCDTFVLDNHFKQSLQKNIESVDDSKPKQGWYGMFDEKQADIFVYSSVQKPSKSVKIIESPFELVLKINDANIDYIRNDGTFVKQHMKTIQDEIDSIFVHDAKIASKIMDHRSYIDTPERYMLAPLLLSKELRARYQAIPLLIYEGGLSQRRSSLVKKIEVLIGNMRYYPEYDIYRKYADDHVMLRMLSSLNEDYLLTRYSYDIDDYMSVWGIPPSAGM